MRPTDWYDVQEIWRLTSESEDSDFDDEIEDEDGDWEVYDDEGWEDDDLGDEQNPNI